jgi:tetratricopeptide (TPR) repeat protein
MRSATLSRIAWLSWGLLAPLAAQNQTEPSNHAWRWHWAEATRRDTMPAPRAGTSSTETVPVDLLLHPIPGKARRMLQEALKCMQSGDHPAAIGQLEKTLAKYPSSAPYVHSLLGFEYLVTDQFAAAVNSFEQAVQLLPHDAANHNNFGISLAAVGDYERAEQEVRRARELDPENPTIQRFLEALQEYKRSHNR